jgi:hypothetical protein
MTDSKSPPPASIPDARIDPNSVDRRLESQALQKARTTVRLGLDDPAVQARLVEALRQLMSQR